MTTEVLDLEKVHAWLEEKWEGPKTCPISGGRNWSIATEFVEFRPYSGGELVLGINVYPQVLVTCTECGYALTFSAFKMGLLSRIKGEH